MADEPVETPSPVASETPPAAVAPAPVGAPAASSAGRILRLLAFLAVAVTIVVCVVGYLVWRDSLGVTTDDAFLRADVVQVPAEAGGRIVEVRVAENQHVKQGDLLLKVDRSDYQLKVAQAAANLKAAQEDADRARSAATVTRSDAKKGTVRLADARREAELQRRLAAGGASVEAAVDRASGAASIAAQDETTARAGIDVAEKAIDAAAARVEVSEVALQLAQRDLDLTEVHAPCDGVAQRVDLQVGEMVQRGQPTLAIVPDARYVVANFKETDLTRIHVGASVDVELDAYPDADLTGTVDSLGAGTGAIFSLIPADNASGNFIKVVQRVPVRIKLTDPKAATFPAGLSATVLVKSGT